MNGLLEIIKSVDELVQKDFKKALSMEFHIRRDGDSLVISSIMDGLKITNVLREGESILDSLCIIEQDSKPMFISLREVLKKKGIIN